MNSRTIIAALGMAMVSAIGTASAAPTMSPTNLPIDEPLLQALAAQGKTQADIEAFLLTLSGIQVYDDHKNPPDTDRGNRSKAKIFWAAPFFTAGPARSVVGAEQFADHALTVLDEIDDLLDSFALEAKEFRRLQSLRKDLSDRVKAIDRALLGTIDPIQRASLEALRPTLVAEQARVEQDITDLVNAANDGATQLGVPLRRSIADAILLNLSRLGVTPTTDEQNLLGSDVPSQWVLGLTGLRARAAEGQFGLRQVVLEAGYTAQQLDALHTYLALRPDVTTRGLPVRAVFARPTAQTLIDQNGQYVTRNAVMQLRGVNLGSAGACGSTRSCNVVIEYTDVGARAVRFLGLPTALTPVLLPVMFEADVRVQEPDFVGSIFCNFKTGWTAQGRADVKDGAIIYDGDLSNKIKYDSVDSGFGGCSVTVLEGDKDSALYHILMDMDANYRKLHSERQQAAKQEKDAYRARIEAELQWHERNSQSRSSGGWFSDVFGLVIHGNMISGLAGLLIGETRDFYWHTTTLDTHNIDPITVRQSYNVHNVTAVRKFAFDGFPLVCYTPVAGGGRLIKACPDSSFPDGTTEVDTGDITCPEKDIFGDCIHNR